MKNVLLMLIVLFAQAARAQVVVEDYLGRRVELEKPAQRIIALAPHIVENLYAAGAGDRLVAAVDYSDYPPEARALPRIGSFNTVSLETIVARSPDLVVTWLSGNGPAVVEQLSRLGIAVYADEPKTLNDIARSIRDLGHLAGTSAVSEGQAEAFMSRLAALGAGSREAAPRVFYQVWNQPLQTVNGEHLISDVLKLCGASNVFADAPSLAPVVNLESVLERNPDAILASGSGQERPSWLDDWRRFPGLSAVRHDKLWFVPADYLQRHTTRILIGAEAVCGYLKGEGEAG